MGDLSAVAFAEANLETRSLPALARSYPRRFAFYVARPAHSILLKILGCSGEVCGGSILFWAGFGPETASKTKTEMQLDRSQNLRLLRPARESIRSSPV